VRSGRQGCVGKSILDPENQLSRRAPCADQRCRRGTCPVSVARQPQPQLFDRTLVDDLDTPMGFDDAERPKVLGCRTEARAPQDRICVSVPSRQTTPVAVKRWKGRTAVSRPRSLASFTGGTMTMSPSVVVAT